MLSHVINRAQYSYFCGKWHSGGCEQGYVSDLIVKMKLGCKVGCGKSCKKVGERVGLQNKFHKFAVGFHADGLVRGRMEGNQS
jgi:hypothetical protein